MPTARFIAAACASTMAMVHLGCSAFGAADDDVPLAPMPRDEVDSGGDIQLVDPPPSEPDPGAVPDAAVADAGVIPEGGARVFVTSRAFLGSFDQPRGRGDALCTALAGAAGLPGTYIAFAAGRDMTRLVTQRAYYRLDGVQLWDVLPSLDGLPVPLAPIDLDEQRLPVALDARVWTGAIDGKRCRAWTDQKGNDGRFLEGATGNPHDPAAWFRGGVARCDADRRLYCFER